MNGAGRGMERDGGDLRGRLTGRRRQPRHVSPRDAGMQEPQIDPDLEKLSPRNLVEPESFLQSLKPEATDQIRSSTNNALKNDQDNYFTCTICFKMLFDPKQCTQCETAYCADCIYQWNQQQNRCPAASCQNAHYVNLHRVVKQTLDQRRFFCPMPGCTEHVATYSTKIKEGQELLPLEIGLTYSEAIKHQKSCDYKTNACRLGCGAKIQKLQITEHEQICPKFSKMC